jgi:hypothetical protein
VGSGKTGRGVKGLESGELNRNGVAMFDDVRVEPASNSRVKVGMTRDVPLAEVGSTTTRINAVDTIQFLDKLLQGTGKNVVGIVLVAMIHGVVVDAGNGNVAMILLFCLAR